MQLQERIDAAVAAIRAVTSFEPEIGLILGSGLGDYADVLENPIVIPYASLPEFPVSSVPGHKSRFVLGTRFGRKVIAMQGRFHTYEGYTQQEISIPVRVMRKLGVKSLLLTCAAGGIRTDYASGALVAISDHINFSGSNPLKGPNLEELGPRFPDMTDVYSKELRQKLIARAAEEGVLLHEGVYMMFGGPSFETPAEIRMARTMGADLAGMSTVPEAITAKHCGMQVLGVACVTNMAAGILDAPLSHQEVIETAARVQKDFTTVVDLVLRDIFDGA